MPRPGQPGPLVERGGESLSTEQLYVDAAKSWSPERRAWDLVPGFSYPAGFLDDAAVPSSSLSSTREEKEEEVSEEKKEEAVDLE